MAPENRRAIYLANCPGHVLKPSGLQCCSDSNKGVVSHSVSTPFSKSYNPEDMHIWTGLPWNLGRRPAVRVSFEKVLNVLTSVVRLITAFSCIPLELLIPKWHGRCIPTFS